MTHQNKSETVAIIGASEKDGRYAKKAQELLLEKGHTVVPITPIQDSIGGIPAFSNINDIPESVSIDTVTLYIRPERLEPHMKSIIDRKVRRVIFNPGTESPKLEATLQAAGIATEQACTLILLNTGQFS